MKRNSALILAAVVGFAGCTDSQQASTQYPNSSRFTDSHVYRSFLEKLDENGIKYRKGSDQLVYYSAGDVEKVKAISAQLTSKYYPGCGVSFTDKAEMELVERELKNQGIPFAIVELDYGPTITCSPDHRDALVQIVRSCRTAKNNKKS